MKKFTLLLIIAFFGLGISVQAQTVDDIINSYFENTGGDKAWGELKGVKMSAKVSQQGMEIPIEIVRMADGKQYTKITIQGMSIMQGVFDGKTVWSTNFQTMKAEKADKEITDAVMKQANDFPDQLYHYKKKGYKAELMGKETVEGSETFKVKLITEPTLVDGKEMETATFYFFDAESMVPIMIEKEVLIGPQKGIISQVKIGEYNEVDGLYFPFSMHEGIKDGMSQPITIVTIEVNPEVSDADFSFPEN